MLKIEIKDESEVLRNISEPIKTNEIKNYIKLGKEMLKYIKNPEHEGVGLAAPQVGHNKRMVVVSLLEDREDESFSTVLMINPEILEHSEETDIDREGCLSIPGENGLVERWLKIKLRYIDIKGNTKTLILKGLKSRIVQHEVDHLDGILFTDKLVQE